MLDRPRETGQTAPMPRGRSTFIVLALAAGLAGCGGDDGNEGAMAGTGDKEAFCRLASSDELEGFDGLEDFDPADAADVDELERALDDITSTAPPAIRDDVRIVAEGVRELMAVLSEVDTSDPGALAELGKRAEELEGMQAEMERASENVDRYLEEECGIDPDR